MPILKLLSRHINNTLKGNIFYYYDGELPYKLEDGLIINSSKKRLVDLIKGHFNLNEFSLAEQAVITSFKNNNIDLVFAEYGGTGKTITGLRTIRSPLNRSFSWL